MAPTTVATWLKQTRLGHAMPENGRPWTQDYFLERIKAETGWAPAYALYIRYEQGKSVPRADTLQRLIDFWVSLGEDAPEFVPQTEPDTRDPMTRLAEAIEGQNRILLKLLSAVATEGEMSPETRRQFREFVDAVETAPTQLPRPTLVPSV
jgi:hypothetical protein